MYTRKQLPKSQYELSQGVEDKSYTRENDIRRDVDTIKNLNVGLFDIDNAIKYYFDEVIKPEVVEFGNKIKVPVVYGSPEKWKNVQADGYFRDKQGKILVPLISYRRTSITKNKTLSSKIDANYPQLYYTQEVKYTQENRYDQFNILTNSKPIKTYISTVVPDYVDVTYDVVIWTDYVESMNKIVESIIYTEGSYWGDKHRFKFRTKVDNFTNTTDLLADADRVVRTSFQLTLFGYIVPENLSVELSKKQSNKVFDYRQLVLETNPDPDPTVFQGTETSAIGGAVSVTAAPTQIPSAVDNSTIVYLNTNKAVIATSVDNPNIAYFNASFLASPPSLPSTSVNSFTFFINGQYVEPRAIISFVEYAGSGVCVLTVDVVELGFTLAATDEIVSIGKFI